MCSYIGHIVTGFGLLGVLLGSLTLAFYDDLYMYILTQKLVLTPGSMSYEMWETLPIPMYTKIYFFNCTNAPEVMENGTTKPLLKQVGPYTFREEHKKVNISFNDNYTVNFFQKKYFYFEPDMSNGNMDDEIFTPNMIAIAASDATRWPDSFAKGDYPFMRNMMDSSIKMFDEKLFVKVRVGNLTFEGINSQMLHMGDDSPLGPIIQGNIPFDRFGWFYQRNGSETYDGEFQMFTGEDDIYKVGQITSWNRKNNVGQFYPAPCDRLEGSAGEFFPMDQSPTSVSYFTSDLCRPIHFNFKEETTVSDIHGYKYQLDGGFINNSTFNGTNACYNPDVDLMVDLPSDYLTGGPAKYRPFEGELNLPLPNGLLNVSSCKYNAPSYVSFPHFYLADPVLLDQFHPDSDLNPNEADHSCYITMMPKEAIPLEVAIRLQINVLYRPFDGCPVEIFENVPPTFYPAIWFETHTVLADDMAGDLKMLEIVPELGTYIGMFSLGMGVSGVVLGPIIVFIMMRMRRSV